MPLNVIKASYKKDYQLFIEFDNSAKRLVNLKKIIFQDKRKIFSPLREIEYFKKFQIKFNTISWENELDLAPEFLLKIGEKI